MNRFGQMLRRGSRYEELSESMREHLEEKIADLMDDGMTREQAERAARIEFGNMTMLEERGRQVWQWSFVETLPADVKFAARQMRKAPAFTVTCLLTLALGIGANTAVFSAINAILLHPLPYQDPSCLVLVSETLPLMNGDNAVGVSAQEYLDYKRQNSVFTDVAASEPVEFNLTGTGQPQRVNAARISATALPVLGVAPEIGRNFTEAEDRYGSDHVVLLSHELWASQYGSDPAIVGKAIHMDETAYMVVGVMPASFRFPLDGAPPSERASVWLPMAFAPNLLKPENRTMEFGVGLIGRLKPGISTRQAQSNMDQIATRFMREHGYAGTLRVVPHVYPFAAHSVEGARALLILLAGAVFCVLLIASANIANLLLARATSRQQEMALRIAIGANRLRLVRQCLVESALMGVLGSIAGVGLAIVLVEELRRFGPTSLPRLQDVTVHPIVLLFAVMLSLITSLFFGFAPAWRLSRVPPQASLRTARQASGDRGSQTLQNSVATAQIALAFVLLIAGGLLLRSFVRLMESPFGFNPKDAFVVRTVFDQVRYPDPARRDVVQKELLDRLSRLPGVESVAEATHLPLTDSRQIGFRLEHAAPDDYQIAENSLVSWGYFRALGIALIAGRDFTPADQRESPAVAIISRALSRKYFAGQNPIGKHFEWGGRGMFTIIGVAADVHISSLDSAPPPMIYFDMFQVQSGVSGKTAIILRGRGANADLLPSIRGQVRSLDRELPLYEAATLQSLVSESLAQRSFVLVLLGAFAATALLLAAVGIFGVISYLVAQRSREFGVRVALGANRSQITHLVLARGAWIAIMGCICGLGLSVFASRLLLANLYQTSRFDPAMLCLVPLLLFLVVLLASWIPARRAARIDPMEALRGE
ncbi:MAG TPA: ABC transporter permease [Terracidiphilus sp.]|nr:ABC transporter permease [Terracidiphilus sp.]